MEENNLSVLCGIRPSGRMHLGHYFSVIRPALMHNASVLIADYHAPDSVLRQAEVREMIATLFQYGINPLRVVRQTITMQDPVNLAMYFGMLSKVSVAELSRMTQFKSADIKDRNAHMLTYPVLMACDILGYDIVIVGEDQQQHLELASRLLKRVGAKKVPTGVYEGGRVMSFNDPDKKMSKSDPNGCIFLDDPDLEVKVLKATTTQDGIKNLAWVLNELTGEEWDERNNAESKRKLILAIKGIPGWLS